MTRIDLLSNPMTTAEDIIVGGSSGVPERLAAGSEGDVLQIASGVVAWGAVGGGGSWQDWTPTITQSGSVSITINYAKYLVVGNVTLWRLRVTAAANGTSANDIVIGGQPSQLQDVNAGQTAGLGVVGHCQVGTGVVKDEGTAYYPVFVYAQAAQDWRLNRVSTDSASFVGSSPSFALSSANSDSIVAEGIVRTA